MLTFSGSARSGNSAQLRISHLCVTCKMADKRLSQAWILLGIHAVLISVDLAGFWITFAGEFAEFLFKWISKIWKRPESARNQSRCFDWIDSDSSFMRIASCNILDTRLRAVMNQQNGRAKCSRKLPEKALLRIEPKAIRLSHQLQVPGFGAERRNWLSQIISRSIAPPGSSSLSIVIAKWDAIFTSTYSSRLNQVEIWFAKIQRDVIARGIFRSVKDLANKRLRRDKSKTRCPMQANVMQQQVIDSDCIRFTVAQRGHLERAIFIAGCKLQPRGCAYFPYTNNISPYL